jgi:hypothetical protein
MYGLPIVTDRERGEAWGAVGLSSVQDYEDVEEGG